MKGLSWKKIAVAVVAISLATAGIFYFNANPPDKSTPHSVNPAFAEYISAYTTGVIPSGSVVSIVFTRDIVDSTLEGQESIDKLFDFTPSISGKTVWLDKRTVEFRPENRMAPGKVYNVKFFLSRVAKGVPDDLHTFEYSFRVIPQNFEVVIVNTKPYNNSELENGKIEGTFSTADYAPHEKVEETVEAAQGGKKLDLSWSHDSNGRQHHFTVEGVVRKDQPDKVDILVSGSPIGIDRSQEMEVEIPSISDFKLMRAWVVQSPAQHVVLQFSDPLKETQNLHGFITISGLPSLDYDIHDNEIRVYPPVLQDGTKVISVGTGIRNAQNRKLSKSFKQQIVFEQAKPAVRFTGKGSILPGTHGLVLPFEAVNLNAVDVHVIKVFENNVLQFFQVNNHESNNELRRVGKRIFRKKIALENTGITDPGKWTRYTLDVAKLIQSEPGAIYEIKLSFKHAYSTYGCQASGETLQATSAFEDDEYEDEGDEGYYYDYYDDYYYGEDFDWRQRENPCHASYYTSNRAVSKNILASDLGITVKRGEDSQTLAFITDLITAKPIKGVNVSLYNFQLQQIGQALTDADGKIVIGSKEAPFALVAEKGSQRGYLRMVNGEALLVSNFNVSGDVIQKGLKGFLYGERGVWRPGDSLYLTFVLEDKRDLLPANHPVVFELSNPQGQVMNRIVRSVSENGFYSFATATAADAPTGNWMGRVKVGGTEFRETLKIESVKPNRLKINFDFGTDKFTSPKVNGKLEVKWLHGAPGRNLRAEFEVILMKQPTVFEKFSDYNFDDPSREFESESQPFFEGNTDSEGMATVEATFEQSGAPSGFLNAVFRGKVYEESGNFSIDRFSIPYYPYPAFVGIRLPEGEKYSGILYTDTNHKVAIATVDAEGKTLSREGIEVNMYKLDWRWWWENTHESLANFVEGSYSTLVKSEKINTTGGKGEFTFNLQAAEYGRYFLRVCDPVSGHCAGEIVYVDEPGWYSRARSSDARGGANLLSFSTDRTQYNIGEKIQMTIPGSAQGGRALISVENGSKVLQTHWVETQQGETRFSIDAVPEMSPNVYIHASLLQPHGQTVNDMPIRLYGVTGVQVEDPTTHLEPVLTIPDVLVPGEEVTIKVSEKSNRKMTFTLAVVDEGLLDLTRFKTPDAWRVFYAREALGVRTWDIYDHVMGAFGANLERFISIGGDDAIAPGEIDPLANRFKPVVQFFGPYTLNRGSREINFIMPQYIGSVKTMVVAGYQGAYGKAEKVSAVRKPLMVLATLPRVLGPDEIVKLPVTLFTGDKDLDINVEVNVKGPLALTGARTKSISLAGHSDATLDFDLDVQAATGSASVEVKATSGNLTATDLIEILIRNPNLPVTRVDEFLLEEEKTWSTTYTPSGLSGTNSAMLEVSSMPPVNLGSRMRYLLQYPHGCLEQTTSSVFPQLYLDQVKVLNQTEKDVIQKNVKAGIERLRSFVQADGGFGYWPGVSESTDTWGTSYAGHFLVEAEKKGYYVPADLINRWKNFQRNKAIAWQRNTNYFNSDLLQAYRLYTLALAGSPDLGAMNRLREEEDMNPTAAWMLSSAYAVSGQVEAARKLINNLPVTVKPYRELGYTYGSDLRDKALILETLILLAETTKAFEVLKEISAALGNDGTWLSTQETAMCLRAVASFSKQHKRGDLKFTYNTGNGKNITTSTVLALAQVEIPVSGLKPNLVEVRNESEGVLFTRLITTGTPARGAEEDASHHLLINVNYTDGSGNTIDPSRLEQGSEFVVEVNVAHPGLRGPYENLALSQVFPSGWEIANLRLEEADAFLTTSPFRYQDIRDDRVFTYFDLAPNEQRTFRLLVTATYAGTFYLPAVSCEAMYDQSIYARTKGRTVSVSRRDTR